MGYAAVGALFLFIIIFIIVWYVADILSILGIVFGCISCSNSKKYVNTKGLGNFKSIRSYHTAATVFMIISAVVIALWICFAILLEVEMENHGGISSDFDDLKEFFAESIYALAIHIASVVAGIAAQVQYKKAKELNADILSGKVAPPPPVVPMMNYQMNPYQQNGYNGQPNNPYQQNNGYYNGQYNNGAYQPYPQQNPYSQNPQGYQQQPQNNAYNVNGQIDSQPQQNNAFINGQSNTESQFPDPTIGGSANQSFQSSTAKDNLQGGNDGNSSETTILCPNCGSVNSDKSKFCTNCGQIMK